jgi:two-component system LytT family response regulator
LTVKPRHSYLGKVLPLHKNGIVPSPETTADKIVISSSESLEVISLRNILYFKSESNYTKIRLTCGSEHLVSKTLRIFESKLNKNFLRVHNSYIINLRHIESYSFQTCNILLQEEIIIPVSRRKKAELISYLKGFQI